MSDQKEQILYFAYSSNELSCLCSKDKRLSRLVAAVGLIKRRIYPDPFFGLVHSIIGQQISGKAHAAISRRFMERFGNLDARQLAAVEPEKIRECGIALRKVECIQLVARKFATGEFSAEILAALDDQTLAATLASLRGIGDWTAHMLLIFTFQRRDVLSFGDLGIRRGLCLLYGHEKITPQLFERYRHRYSPYGSIASLYLWELAGRPELAQIVRRPGRKQDSDLAPHALGKNRA